MAAFVKNALSLALTLPPLAELDCEAPLAELPCDPAPDVADPLPDVCVPDVLPP